MKNCKSTTIFKQRHEYRLREQKQRKVNRRHENKTQGTELLEKLQNEMILRMKNPVSQVKNLTMYSTEIRARKQSKGILSVSKGQ